MLYFFFVEVMVLKAAEKLPKREREFSNTTCYVFILTPAKTTILYNTDKRAIMKKINSSALIFDDRYQT